MSHIQRCLMLWRYALVASFALSGCAASGGPSSSDESEGPASDGAIRIKNLSIAIDKANGESRLTFALENALSKTLAMCSNGSIMTSTGYGAVVSFGSGPCNGIIGPNAAVTEDFCVDAALENVCSAGLVAGESTGILTLHGSTYGSTLDIWEKPGTEYTLKLSFLMDDAESVEATATTAVK